MRAGEALFLCENQYGLTIVREYLTGFHKRKVAKKEDAKKRAQLREKQERQELRREVCWFSVSLYFSHFTPSCIASTRTR